MAPLLVALAALSGCGGAEPPPPDLPAPLPTQTTTAPTSSAAPTPSDSPAPAVAVPGALVLLDCQGDGRALTVGVSAVSPKDGLRIARRQVTLPAMAYLTYACSPRADVVVPDASAQALRGMLDRGLDHLAFLATDPQVVRGNQAQAMDLATGRLVAPPAPVGGGVPAPVDGAPTVDPKTGQLWYVDQAERRLRSRPADAVRAADHGPAPDTSVVMVAGGRAWPNSVRGNVVVNPAGTYAAYNDLGRVLLWRAGTAATAALQMDATSGATHTGGRRVPACTPEVWLDDHRFVCAARAGKDKDGTALVLVTLSADYKAVSQVRTLTTDAGSTDTHVVLAPDHHAIAYQSEQDARRTLYRLDLRGAAKPVKIGDLPPGGGASWYLLEWR
jgi:hypothetical protein